MEKLPFTANRLSPADCEIVLLHKPYLPSGRISATIMLVIALASGLGAIETTGNIYIAVTTGFVVFVLGYLAFPWIFRWKTNQVATPTDLLANATYVMGHIQWPPVWPHSFLETPIRFAWSEVILASIRLKPWVYALDNVQLELTLRSGKVRILRIPRINDDEYAALVQTLRTIATRRGFEFSVAPSTHLPLH